MQSRWNRFVPLLAELTVDTLLSFVPFDLRLFPLPRLDLVKWLGGVGIGGRGTRVKSCLRKGGEEAKGELGGEGVKAEGMIRGANFGRIGNRAISRSDSSSYTSMRRLQRDVCQLSLQTED